MVLKIFSLIVIGINTIYCFYRAYKEQDTSFLGLGFLCALTDAIIIVNIIR
jgi:hypothetical protein